MERITRYTLMSYRPDEIFNAYELGFSTDINETTFGPCIRKTLIIHYVFVGSGYFNGIKIHSGQGFVITPGQKSEYHPDKSDPWGYLWINLPYNASQSVLKYYDTDENKIFSYDFLDTILDVCSKIRESRSVIVSPYFISELCFKIFNEHDTSIKSGRYVETSPYIRMCETFITTNLNRKITVQDLCDELNVSQPYLYKIFKQNLQISPKEFITKKKVQRAKHLLNTTNLPIGEISATIGFSDQFVFSNAFKKFTGESPTQYRKSASPK